LSSPAVDSSSADTSSSSSSSFPPFVLGTLACTYQNYSALMYLYRQLVAVLGRGINPVARLIPTQYNTNREESRINFHSLSGIRIHDPSVWAGEGILCLRPRSHCDRLFLGWISQIYQNINSLWWHISHMFS
jgi:hypothetical protein